MSLKQISVSTQRVVLSLFAILFSQLVFSSNPEKLIIFSDHSNHPVTSSFKNQLPEIKQLATRLNIDVVEVDASKGLPEEVGALPAIYYYNGNKRSYFKGRYNATNRLGNFIQNARRFSFENKPQQLSTVMVQESSHFTKITRLKVTPVSYEDPNTKQTDISKTLMSTIAKCADYSFHETFKATKQAKIHYFDLHPYQSKDGTYYINVAIYSQHNCVVPVFKSTTPFSGKSIKKLGKQIGIWYANKSKELYNNTTDADGLLIPTHDTTTSWEKLGFPLTKSGTIDMALYPLEEGTYYFHPLPNDKAVAFTFAPPLNNYNGSVNQVYGQMTYQEKTLEGTFGVVLTTTSMGDELLDESVTMHQLQANYFPTAQFQFKHKGELSTSSPFTVNGILVLMDKEYQQQATVTFEKQKDGSTLVKASLLLDINPFPSLEKPDGKAPLNHTVHINVISVLKDTKNTYSIPTAEQRTEEVTEAVEPDQQQFTIPTGSFSLTTGKAEFKTDKFGVNGTSTELKAYLQENGELAAQINLNTFSFKKGKTMQKHALGLEGLQASLFPISLFQGKLATAIDLKKEGTQQVKIEGTLDLHGFQVPLTLDATLTVSTNEIKVQTVLPVDRALFDLNGKKASSIDDVVLVKIDLVLSK